MNQVRIRLYVMCLDKISAVDVACMQVITNADDRLLEFGAGEVSNRVFHPSTCHNICDLVRGVQRNTIFQRTASHDS